MRHILMQVIAGAGLLVFGATLGVAQDRDHDRQDRDHDRQTRDRDDWYQSRDTFFHGEHWRANLFQRVREDLDRVQTSSFRAGDEFRIDRTRQELNELQSKLAAGRYDQPELDEVIGALTRVVASNRLSARDRDILTDDLSRMRDYREHHENWEHR
jgi:hypothetical protein